mmetsp:Transcript_113327/g.353302  ORF Transcript_113327/g.353302 Transcript_113327/m.353302 type:complete len:83 (+) Transcript_113327:1367-1615(+)
MRWPQIFTPLQCAFLLVLQSPAGELPRWVADAPLQVLGAKLELPIFVSTFQGSTLRWPNGSAASSQPLRAEAGRRCSTADPW